MAATGTNAFEDYAEIYAHAPYGTFAAEVAAGLPGLWAARGASPRSLLDLACGTGIMLIELAGRLDRATGVDRSAAMLAFARKAAAQAGLDIGFIQADIRDYRADQPYEAVTCIYNTINYFVEADELRRVFDNARASLVPGGLFVFDVHPTRYVEQSWAGGVFVEQNTEDVFEVWENPYDSGTGLLRPTVTAFRRTPAGWQRVHEVHELRGLDPETLTPLLRASGFADVEVYGGLGSEPVDEATERLWFVAS